MDSREVYKVKRRKSITCLTLSALRSKLLTALRVPNIYLKLVMSSHFLTGNSVTLLLLINLIMTMMNLLKQKKLPRTNPRRKKRRKKRRSLLKLNIERSLRSLRRNIRSRRKKTKMKMRTRNKTRSLRKMKNLRRRKKKSALRRNLRR